MVKTPSPDGLRELARRRLQRLENMSPEEWAKAVEEARKQGIRLVRFPGMIVELPWYSLDPPAAGDPEAPETDDGKAPAR